MAQRILVNYGIVTRLVTEGLGSRPSVIKALRGKDNTSMLRKIRQRAIELGGELVIISKTKN